MGSYGQTIFGTVSSENSALPFVTIVNLNNGESSFSNELGQFNILINSTNDSILFEATHFKPSIFLADSIQKKPNVVLVKDIQILKQVTITVSNDFAKRIAKQVIQNRKKNTILNKDFSAQMYTKILLSKINPFTKDSSLVKLNEQVSMIQFQYPKNWRETKLGYNQHEVEKQNREGFINHFGNEKEARQYGGISKTNEVFYHNISDINFNFYESFILIPKISQTPFISPFGNLGLLSYHFKYNSTYIQNGKKIHLIEVIPKRKDESIFWGIAQIEAQTWKIKSLNFNLNPKRTLNFNSFTIIQQLDSINGNNFIKDQSIYFSFKKNKESHYENVHSVFSNHVFSEQTIQQKNRIQFTTDSAYNRNAKYWNAKRPFNLKAKELTFIETIDSVKRIKNSINYIKNEDALKNKVTFWEVLFSGIDHYNTPKGYKWFISPLIAQANIFGIGGVRHVFNGNYAKTFDNKNLLELGGKTNFGFSNKDMVADVELKYTYAPKHFAQFKFRGGSEYQMLTFNQNFATILSRSNWIKNNFLELGHFIELTNGLFLDIETGYYNRISISNLTLSDWSEEVFGENNTPLDFSNYNELNLKLSITYTPFQKYEIDGRKKTILGSKWPNFKLKWEQGIPSIFNSIIHYQKLTFGINQSIRFGLLGTTKYSIWYGDYLHTSSVKEPNNTFFRGTDPYLFTHPLVSFQLLGKTHQATNSYFTLNFIHHFHGALLKKIPLIKRTKLESSFGGGALYIDQNNFAHTELFGGIDIPFKIGQVNMKIGGYYTTAYSNYSALSHMIKFGLNVFNPFTNNWEY